MPVTGGSLKLYAATKDLAAALEAVSWGWARTRADPAQSPTAISPSAGTVVFRGGMEALLESSPALGMGAAGLVRSRPHPAGSREATAADCPGASGMSTTALPASGERAR
jgi:hypothetical protein